ncbi:FAD/FMN-containing dehydrogenase [Actinoalloteichus hoggarensis]|uniref:Mitomycin radical oxidase n=1 Tax=Actinoalloteichus hoggarensis TaxID=1470176 RepID=A0A221W4Z0_9PSEU|nr:FAD-dependent oxidoreductase [Actinoalloteichus hoggarensis]ASO20918.1 Mitomycin radical oxidase [Actinoalloteichus hoggarensis]MBB5920848.1 FAD/FMN-containing dehydrogenase [Actinoalloteichus hoggarensis]
MTDPKDQDGRVARPGEQAYDVATRVFNLAAPARPAAAVTARTAEQVRSAIRHAIKHGMSVRVHSTGHASATASPMEGALLIRTALSEEVRIDEERRVARVPAGRTWRDVVEAAAPYGLAAPHGTSPTVGVVGYVLRGGMSFYSRHVGLAANSVTAVELVDAGGRLRLVTRESDAELFWALRGGGGGFGVVTAVEIALFPVTGVITGAAYWSAAYAPRLLSAWLRWTDEAPTEAGTSLRMMNLPSLPEIPSALTGGPVVCVAGAVFAEPPDSLDQAVRRAGDLLGPLRTVAEPLLDTWAPGTPTSVLDAHDDPTEPVAVLGDHLLLRDLPATGAAAFLRAVAGDSGSPLVAAELRQLGGAASSPHPAGGALDHLDARFAFMAAGLPGGTGSAQSIMDHCATVRAALAPWDTGRTAPTFVENREQPQGHLDADRRRSVELLRTRVDPQGRFSGDVLPDVDA